MRKLWILCGLYILGLDCVFFFKGVGGEEEEVGQER